MLDETHRYRIDDGPVNSHVTTYMFLQRTLGVDSPTHIWQCCCLTGPQHLLWTTTLRLGAQWERCVHRPQGSMTMSIAKKKHGGLSRGGHACTLYMRMGTLQAFKGLSQMPGSVDSSQP